MEKFIAANFGFTANDPFANDTSSLTNPIHE